jgi:sugar/nucleoside kinase (ribokinase family)
MPEPDTAPKPRLPDGAPCILFGRSAARHGVRAMLIPRPGDHKAGQRICDELTAAGMDCRGVRSSARGTSPPCTVIIDDDGERLGVPDCDAPLPADPGWRLLALVSNADAVMVDVRWPKVALALTYAARASGEPAVLDANTGPRGVLPDLGGRATDAAFSGSGAKVPSGKTDPHEALAWLAGRLDAPDRAETHHIPEADSR